MLGCRLVVWVMGDGDFSFLARMPPSQKGARQELLLMERCVWFFGVGIDVGVGVFTVSLNIHRTVVFDINILRYGVRIGWLSHHAMKGKNRNQYDEPLATDDNPILPVLY